MAKVGGGGGGGGGGGLGAEATAEKVLVDLLVRLVDPLLAGYRSSANAPTAEQKAELCKQVHSVVILYNYYHRKQLPQLEYLDHETFCKKAVIVRPCLLKFIEPGNHVERVSLKKTILDACVISTALNPSRESVEIEGWPISRIAVFLVDSKQENCFLEFGSITKGVWSLMELELGKVFKPLVEHTDTKMQAAGSKIKDEDDHCQLALSMVEEKTGVNNSNFYILESHMTYSLSQQRTASRLYIIKSMKPIYEVIDGIAMMPLVDLRDIFTSLRGLLRGTSQTYGLTPMVDYFHVLPYLNILSNWPPRQRTLNARNTSLTVNEAASKQKYPSSGRDSANVICKPETNYVGSSLTMNEHPAIKDHSVSGKFSSSNKSRPYFEIATDSSCEIGLSLAESEPCKVDRILSSNQLQKPPYDRDNIIDRRGLDTCSIKRGGDFSQFRSNGANNVLADKVSMTGLDKKPRIIESKDGESFLRREASQTLQCSTLVSVTDNPLVPFHSYPGSYEFHHLMVSKKDELKEASLRVLQKKRDDLTCQLRHLEDESAQCEMNIQAVRNDQEGSLKLELESIIEACNAFCSSQMYVASCLERNHPQEINSKGLSEEVFSSRSSCKELDDICRQNNWMLPRYTVLPSLNDGNFLASVTVKGLDFESTVHGNSKGNPCESRFSAASAMISQLYSMKAKCSDHIVE